MSTYRAHIFKQRQVGEREEVKIKFFDADGSPLDLGGGAPSESSSGAMMFRGVWDPDNDYKANDVVIWDPGDGRRLYIFRSDAAANASFPMNKVTALAMGENVSAG